MSIADELQLLINTKEQIRLAVGASKDVPFSTYVDLIDGNPAPQLTVDPSLIGIERQTAILANAKESLRVAIGLSTSIPFSQYASYLMIWNPSELFKNGEHGFWVDPSDTSTLFQNSEGTIAVVDGDPIGLVLDKTGNNCNLQQAVSASRPELLDGGIVFDKVDDALTLNVPAGGIIGTLFLATTQGTASYGVSMPEGVWTLGNDRNPLGDVVSAVLVDRALTVDEKARLHVFGIGKGGTEFGTETEFVFAFRGWNHLVDFPLIDTSNGTNFSWAWSACSRLASFPLLDVSRGTNFVRAWNDCSRLTSFPLLDVSRGTVFDRTWSGCSSLVSFPANFFDNCLATNFTNAFLGTKLSQASIDGILVSINSNSTSNGTFGQSGGSAPSIVGQAAIDAMRARGWTVTTTGGY